MCKQHMIYLMSSEIASLKETTKLPQFNLWQILQITNVIILEST